MEGAVQAPVAASQTLATAANWIYVWGHWPVIVATMVWLVWRHRDGFRRLRDGMLVSGFLGMAVFVSYPVAPPRLADLGLVDTVTESSEAYRYLQPPAFVNQYAAMPSLHAGWDLLVGLAIVGAAATVGPAGGRSPDARADGLGGRRHCQPLRPRRRGRTRPWRSSATRSRCDWSATAPRAARPARRGPG